MSDEVQRDLGRHEAQIDQLQRDMTDVKTDVHAIKQILSEARGGWRTLMLVAGVAGTAGAFASKIATILGFIPR